MEQTASARGISRDAVKYLAMGAMLLNHIANIFLIPGALLYEVFTDLGYVTAVTMCFFLVEGYGYTRSKRNYALRLLLFAFLSEIPYCLALTKGAVISFYGLNMMFTLFLCFLMLLALEQIKNSVVKVFAVILITFLSTFCDWPLLAPMFTLLFWWAGQSKRKQKLAFLTAAVLFGLFSFSGRVALFSLSLSLLYALGSMAGIILAGVCIVYLYNGKRGKWGRNFSKWFFYGFYPVHLLILGLIRISAL